MVNQIKRKSYNNIQIDIRSLFVYSAIFLLCANYLLYNFFDKDNLKNYIRVVAIIFIAMSLIFGKGLSAYDCVLIVISIIIVVFNGVDSLNIVACILLGISTDKKKQTFKIITIISTILLLVVFFSLLTGIVKENQYVDTACRNRNTLGFSNVNTAALFFSSYVLCFLMSKERIKIYHIVYAIGVSLLVYYKTNSRTAFLSIIVFILIYTLTSLGLKTITKTFVVLLEVFLLLSPLIFIFPFSESVDRFLSYRITFFKEYIAENSLFNLLFGGTKISSVDNFLLILLFNIGIFYYFAFLCLTLNVTINLMNDGNVKELALIITILAIGLVESTGIRIELGMTMLFWVIIIRTYKETMNLKNKNFLLDNYVL